MNQLNNITLSIIKKSELKNLTIFYSFQRIQFGEIIIASTEEGICFLEFVSDKDISLERLKKRYLNATLIEKEQNMHIMAIRYIQNPKEQKLALHVYGTDFQIQVWKELLKVKKGTVSSYNEIAKSINNPKANRAVGSAVGANPITLIIPCHRVVLSTGKVGNYLWGSDMKKKILNSENYYE